ncbi:hypothetical protein Leryth_012154 [Lithospermum erythrorhizon]|nr:hypothetical protein Leryth_012154 [Lithospermum erythrorhizon]
MASSQSSAFFLILLTCFTFAIAHQVSYNGRAITIDGQRRLLLSGSIHYPRSTPEMWPDLINKAKEGGLNTIETYVFWNAHEAVRREYDFTGNLDLVRFIKTIKEAGLYSVLRIGPYVCAEWNYGGFPVWLHNMEGIEFRTVNEVFMNEMQNFTTKIVDMMKQEKLFAIQGGPIILAQIENEYGNVMSSYGFAGKAYVNWCADMAQSLDIGVPWIMCQQSNAPQPMINTCNGWYCDQFTPNNPNSPKMWTENWTGWFKNWGGPDPKRTSEDLAFAVARFFQTGGTFQNYYMYHGGTNFGRTAGGPYISTSYDYDAPLDEYGNLNQPKYGHLKELHYILRSMEKALTYGNVTTTDFGNSVSVPAWSVSIYPDCKTEAYNTAKVNAQTSIMVKESNYAQEKHANLKWSYTPENIQNHVRLGQRMDVGNHVLLGKDEVSTNHLVDQKRDNDASDYLWYMTSVNMDKNDPIMSEDMSLKVNGTSQVIVHAYVNGEYLGSQWNSPDIIHFPLVNKTKLKSGNNEIIFLSGTVGLKNYGPKFDLTSSGIAEVHIVGKKGDETIVKDLSNHTWTYKVGLHGLSNQFYSSSPLYVPTWEAQTIPTNRKMSWYKTTFKTPLGKDPVVADFEGLGKGFAWVNGHNIGRYWPAYLADPDACSNDPCDYRGAYDNNKCVYHVPRDWLNKDVNELVLFEEIGGNPSQVSFKTVRPGTICASVAENKTMELSCDRHPISSIQFVGFGDDTQGTCGAFETSNCAVDNQDALKILHDACVGKNSCSVPATQALFGKPANCIGETNKLVVQAVC